MEEWSNTKQLVQYSSPPVLQSSNTPVLQSSNTPVLQYSRRHLGFTLLEVMIAVTIIAIVVVAIFGSQSQSLSLANDAKFNTTAALLAQRKMAEVETASSLDVSAASGDFGEDFPEYQWELNISKVPLTGTEGLEYIKQVDVIVHWGDRDNLRYALRLYRFMPRTR
jgi:general secretion pathway protein I